MTVNHLTNRRASMMEEDYPLTLEQVQAITYPPRMQEFVALGFDSFQQTWRICYELGPEQGLGRRSVTEVQLPGQIPYAFNRQLVNNYQEHNPAYFNPDALDEETMAKLKTWTEKAVYERRLAMLTTTTVTEFFKHTPKLSMYHIMARWPGLKVVFPRVEGSSHRNQGLWERASNEVPRNLQRWGWPGFGNEADWYRIHEKRLRLAEETLLSCVSLSKPEDTGPHYGRVRKLTARVTDWQKLGDAPF
jgi:hypothetical protein